MSASGCVGSSSRIDFSSLGTRVCVCVDDETARTRIAALYAACLIESGAPLDLEIRICADGSGSYELREDGEPCVRDASFDEMLEWLAWRVNSVSVATERSDLVLHAAAAARAGKAVVVTGASGVGKSTLGAALVVSGMAYMGDDTLLLAPSARLRSNPKPIGLDAASHATLARIAPDNTELRPEGGLVAPAALGGVVAADVAITASLVVRPVYVAGAPTRVRALSAADAAEMIADQSFNFATLGSAALRAVVDLACRVRAVEVEYGDLSGAVEAISVLLLEPAPVGAERLSTVADASRPDLEVEIVAGEALIWSSRTSELHHLSESATTVWLACRQSCESAAIVSSIVGTGAAPASLIDEVEQCVRELRTLGLVAAPSSPDTVAR